MSIDKFGRYYYYLETLTSESTNDFSTSKIYLDNCLKKITISIEAQLKILINSQNQLHEIYKKQTNSVINNIEIRLQKIDINKEQINFSIFNFKKNSTEFEKRRIKQDVQNIKLLKKTVEDLEIRMTLKNKLMNLKTT